MPTIADEFKAAALDGGLARLNLGSTDANGDVQLLTAADAELAKGELSVTAFAGATVAAGIASANSNAIAPDSTISQGTFEKIRFRNRDNGQILTFTCGVQAAAWQANTNYALNAIVRPTTPNGRRYIATADAGSSAGSEPTWPTTVGATVVDGGITWTCALEPEILVNANVIDANHSSVTFAFTMSLVFPGA